MSKPSEVWNKQHATTANLCVHCNGDEVIIQDFPPKYHKELIFALCKIVKDGCISDEPDAGKQDVPYEIEYTV